MAVLDNVRAFNKLALNPLMLRLAGRKYWYASVIEHTGRHSGKNYATPVATERVPDGFVIPLPYGVGVDWAAKLPRRRPRNHPGSRPNLPSGAARDHPRRSGCPAASARKATHL